MRKEMENRRGRVKQITRRITATKRLKGKIRINRDGDAQMMDNKCGRKEKTGVRSKDI
jgi:hypothetical protein